MGRLPFRPDEPAVFAWLGVTMYPTRAAIEGTWRAVCSVAARGEREQIFAMKGLFREGLQNAPIPDVRRVSPAP